MVTKYFFPIRTGLNTFYSHQNVNVNALELKFHAYDWALSDPLEHLDLDGWGFFEREDNLDTDK